MDFAIFAMLLLLLWAFLTVIAYAYNTGTPLLLAGIAALLAGLILAVVDRGTYETMAGVLLVGISLYQFVLGGAAILGGDF